MDEEHKYTIGPEPDRTEILRRFQALDERHRRDRLRERLGLMKYALLQTKRALMRRRPAA